MVYVFAAGNNGNGDDGGLNGSGELHWFARHGQERHHGGRHRAAAGDHQRGNGLSMATPIPRPCGRGRPIRAIRWQRFRAGATWGIGIEGDFGRFKPDVVAPGTFVVSTRSRAVGPGGVLQSDQLSHHWFLRRSRTVGNNELNYPIFVPTNAVAVELQRGSVHAVVHCRACRFMPIPDGCPARAISWELAFGDRMPPA